MLTYLDDSDGLLAPCPLSPRPSLLSPPPLVGREYRKSWSGADQHVPLNATYYRPVEVPTEACSIDGSTSTTPSRRRVRRSPVSYNAHQSAVIPPSPLPRSISDSRSECSVSWVVPPRNISLAEHVNGVNWQSHDEKQSTAQYLSPRRTSQDRRGRTSRSPNSYTSRGDHERGRSRSGGSRRYAESLPADDARQSHQGQAGHRGRDRVANLISAFALGAWWMARAAR